MICRQHFNHSFLRTLFWTWSFLGRASINNYANDLNLMKVIKSKLAPIIKYDSKLRMMGIVLKRGLKLEMWLSKNCQHY